MSKKKKSISLRVLSWSGFIFGSIGAVISILTYFSSADSLELQRKIEGDRTAYEAMDLLHFKPTSAGKFYWYIERAQSLTTDEDRTRLENARRKISTLEQLDPDRPELPILKFSYYAQFGDEKGLEKVLYTEIDPDKRADTLILLAAFMANLKESSEAAEPFYKKAFELEPNNPNLYRSYGTILHSFGKNDDAISQLRIALSLSPDNTIIVNDLAHVLSESGQQDLAKQILMELVEKESADARSYNTLGMLEFYSNNFEKAKEFYIKALELRPEHGLFHKNISLAYKKLGNVHESERHLRLASQDGALSKKILDSEHVHH